MSINLTTLIAQLLLHFLVRGDWKTKVERGHHTQTQLTFYVFWIFSPLLPHLSKRGTTPSNHVQVNTSTQRDPVHHRNFWTSFTQIRHRPSPGVLEVYQSISLMQSCQNKTITFFSFRTLWNYQPLLNCQQILQSRNGLDFLGSLCLLYNL